MSKVAASSKLERGFDINERYTKLSQREHVLRRPDTYVGGTDSTETEAWVWDEEQSHISRRKISFPPALLKIFDEILVNARDHSVRDETCNKIRVELDRETGSITVENNGEGIAVELHDEGCMLPELIFGRFRAGENFSDKEQKVVGGRNGLGAKLANVFSTRFEIDTVDKFTSKRYVQVWEDNMSVRHDPEVSSCRKAPYTKITFTPDYERLGGVDLKSDDIFALLKRRVYDMAACTREQVLIYFNGEKLAIRNFEKYMNLYLGDSKSAVPRIYADLKNEGDHPDIKEWQFGIALSDDGFKQVSFVNGIATSDGGTHVDYIRDKLVRSLGKLIREKSPNSPVKPAYIRENMMLFINAVVVNPAFSSQVKESLTTKPDTFGFKHSLDPELIETIEKRLKISKRAIGLAELRKPSALKAAGGRKKQKLTGILKLEDAKFAGSRRSGDCTLILTEGDSAKTMAMDGLQIIGRDYYGVFPLKGKPLNARNASDDQLAKNEEFTAFMKIMGLQPGVEYTDASQLRYGSIMLMTDQDLDGFHIKGIKINNILHMWPSLLKIPGFIKCFVTPIVKLQPTNLRSRRQEMLFFNMSEFEAYRTANPDGMRGMKVRYLKGLGSSEPKEARAYFADFARFVKEYRPMDETLETCKETFEHAFSNTFADWRKKWLEDYDEELVYDYTKPVFRLEDHVDRELKHFSIYDNQRSLGHSIDGLKISQRKALWALREMNLWNDTKKVLAVAGEISSRSSYHHGEKSMMDTSVGMAQTFVGSNNVNLFYPSGQFGSRLKNGADASDARYIHTRLNSITKFIFRSEDDPVLRYEVDDEGKQIEPRHFVPVVATVLLNGCSGIGTGYSTDVPMYHPLEVVDNHLRLLRGEPLTEMVPWYRGFRGTIKAVSSKPGSFYSTGIYERVDDTTVRVTEVPVGQSFDSYKEFLEAHLMENAPTSTTKTGKRKAMDKNKYFIKEYESQTFPTRCDYSITFADKATLDGLLENDAGANGLLKRLKLRSTIHTRNMHLFTEKGAISRLESPEEIINHHSRVRLELYGKRKDHQLREMAEKIAALDRKSRFIQLVLDGTIETKNRPKREIAAMLVKHKLVDDVETAEEDGLSPQMKTLLRISLLEMTEEEVAKFLTKIEQLKEERATLEATTPEQLWTTELKTLRTEMERFLEEAALEDELEVEKKPKKRAVKREKTSSSAHPKKKTKPHATAK